MPLLQLTRPIHPLVAGEGVVVSTAFEDAVEARSEHEAPLVVDELHRLLQNHGTQLWIKVSQIQRLWVIGIRITSPMASPVVPVKLLRRTMRLWIRRGKTSMLPKLPQPLPQSLQNPA